MNDVLEIIYTAPTLELANIVKEYLENAKITAIIEPGTANSIDKFNVLVPLSYVDDAINLIETQLDRETSFKLIYTATEMSDAEVIKGFLQTQGIPTHIEYETLGQIEPWILGSLCQVRIFVPENYVEEAVRLISDKNRP